MAMRVSLLFGGRLSADVRSYSDRGSLGFLIACGYWPGLIRSLSMRPISHPHGVTNLRKPADGRGLSESAEGLGRSLIPGVGASSP
jgi:hypothetical protein